MPMPLVSSKVRYRFFLESSAQTCWQVIVAVTAMPLCVRFGAFRRNQSFFPSLLRQIRYPLRMKAQRKFRTPLIVCGYVKDYSFQPEISVVRATP